MITLSGIILVILTFSVITNIYSQEDNNNNTSIAKTLYFQIEIPDDWVYEITSQSSITKILGFGPLNVIGATPVEYYDLNSFGIGSAFLRDADYTVRNAPLDAYVKYGIDRLEQVKIVSQKDVIVANETARQIEYEGIGEKEGFKGIQYYLFHDKEPYFISFGSFISGEDSLYEKYLPDFEKMLKSFKWLG